MPTKLFDKSEPVVETAWGALRVFAAKRDMTEGKLAKVKQRADGSQVEHEAGPVVV